MLLMVVLPLELLVAVLVVLSTELLLVVEVPSVELLVVPLIVGHVCSFSPC